MLNGPATNPFIKANICNDYLHLRYILSSSNDLIKN